MIQDETIPDEEIWSKIESVAEEYRLSVSKVSSIVHGEDSIVMPGDLILVKGYHDLENSKEEPFLVLETTKVIHGLIEKEIGRGNLKKKVKIKGKHYREEIWVKCKRKDGTVLHLPECLIIDIVEEDDGC